MELDVADFLQDMVLQAPEEKASHAAQVAETRPVFASITPAAAVADTGYLSSHA